LQTSHKIPSQNPVLLNREEVATQTSKKEKSIAHQKNPKKSGLLVLGENPSETKNSS
jgi:hypothetical protein